MAFFAPIMKSGTHLINRPLPIYEMGSRIHILFVLLLCLAGCSKKQADTSSQPENHNITASKKLPFEVVVVDTPETAEMQSIGREAEDALVGKSYDELEAMALRFRGLNECYADGGTKLGVFYKGFVPSDDDADGVWRARFDELRMWEKAKPKSFTARIALANCLVSFAWKARGGDVADKVDQDSWRLFFERLGEATNVLGQAKVLGENCPKYWSTMLEACQGLQVERPEYDNLFQQAIEEYPYYTYYYRLRGTHLLPRWYGKEGEWQKDLAQSADRIGGEEGDLVYAQVVWNIHHYGEGIDVFEGNDVSWDRVDRGFEVILKRFPNSLAAKNERAHLAALAGDPDKARSYFAETKGQVDLSAWHEKSEFIHSANWAFDNKY
jgi:hypothetical protein